MASMLIHQGNPSQLAYSHDNGIFLYKNVGQIDRSYTREDFFKFVSD